MDEAIEGLRFLMASYVALVSLVGVTACLAQEVAGRHREAAQHSGAER